jgi:alpha-L-rhamnosidase
MRLTHSFLAAALIVLTASAQNLPLRSRFASNGLHPLDATRDVKSPRLESSIHTPLPEEYIWTADDALAPGEKLRYSFLT